MREVPEDYYLALVRLWNLHDQLDRDLDDIPLHDKRFRAVYASATEEIDHIVEDIRAIRAEIAGAIREGLEGK